MIKLIMTDIDGTLLNTKKTIVSKADLLAAKMAEENNIRFILASGRLFCCMEKIYEKLALSTPAVSCNGAYIRDLKKVYLKENINANVVEEVVNVYDAYDVKKFVYSDNQIYCTKEDVYANIVKAWEWGVKGILPINILKDSKEVLEATKNNCQKILVCTKDLTQKQEMKKVALQFESHLNCVSAEILNLEFGKKGISKASAMDFLADMYKISVAQVLAIGDSENDISMIKKAGIGIAVGNASKELKDVANFVEANCEENAVAKSIAKYVFKN